MDQVNDAAPDALLVMRGVRKRFGGTLALGGVDLDVRAGEIHALLGENGAGKSSLMKILAGAIALDDGAMTLAGATFAPHSPIASRDAGVAMIYQELTLAPHLTVMQNLLLGREQLLTPTNGRAALQALGLVLDPGTVVRHLGPGERQLVEIARALVGAGRVVVLDEPTSSLGPAETARVFTAMRRLRDGGYAVVFISHHLDEVRAVADCCTVLRDGRTVWTGALTDATDDELIERMAGRPVAQLYPLRNRTPGEVAMTVENLAGIAVPRHVSLTLRRGEIFGIAGLIGAGRTEFLRGLFRLQPVRSGHCTIGAWRRHAARGSPHAMLKHGVGLLSEDRKSEGVALRLPVAVNVMLSSLERCGRGGTLRHRLLAARTERWLQTLAIKVRDPWQRAGELSGGNQQKVALARMLEHDVDIFLLDEPTRGIDIASKAQIYLLLAELAAKGKAILMVSSVASELLGLCDRIAVMNRGVLGDARPFDEWNEASILRAASATPADGKGSAA